MYFSGYCKAENQNQNHSVIFLDCLDYVNEWVLGGSKKLFY